MRNLVINCNVSVKDSFDEEKVKDAFMSLFIVTVNSDVKINGFRINEIDNSVLEQIPPNFHQGAVAEQPLDSRRPRRRPARSALRSRPERPAALK